MVAGCAILAPTQEMSDARQALQAARQAGAAHYAPENLGDAQRRLTEAERAIGNNDYKLARAKALAVKEQAVAARNIALAIGAATEAVDAARGSGAAGWREAREMLERAQVAAKSGDSASAAKLAEAAKKLAAD